MSRFFRAGESDSDDSDDYSEEISDSEIDSDDSDESSDDEPRTATKPSIMNRLEKDYSDSDSDDDTVRVVRSAKDKRFEEIEQAVTLMANKQKINDWVSAQNGMATSVSDELRQKQITQKKAQRPRGFIFYPAGAISTTLDTIHFSGRRIKRIL